MYIPQLFETISQPIHAERVANSERQRFASASVDGSSNVRAASNDASYCRLARALSTLALRAVRPGYGPGRLPSRGE
jgi:hypothetical protein